MSGMIYPVGRTEEFIGAAIGAGVLALAKITRGYYDHSAVEDFIIRVIPGMNDGPGLQAKKLFIAELLIGASLGILSSTIVASQVAESILGS